MGGGWGHNRSIRGRHLVLNSEDEKKMEKATRTVEEKMAKKRKMHDVKEAT